MMTYQAILENAQQLSAAEKARLLAEISASLQHELHAASQPKRSLLGIWQGVDIAADEIDAARAEMWGNFPHSSHS